MHDILADIVADKRIEVAAARQALPLERLAAMAMETPASARSMSRALASSPYGIISEFKRKSPSKGWIHEDADPLDVIPSYQEAGASALSILTDMKYFGGTLEFIQDVRPLVDIPILRKEFIIDEYQLFQARRAGADAVLLIAADLTLAEARTLTAMAHELKLEVLMELHAEQELDYAALDVDMVGINNRNLGTFHTDVQNSFHMIDRLPGDKVKVSESGIGNPETIQLLRAAGYRGFLMGEHFMKQDNPGQALHDLIQKITC